MDGWGVGHGGVWGRGRMGVPASKEKMEGRIGGWGGGSVAGLGGGLGVVARESGFNRCLHADEDQGSASFQARCEPGHGVSRCQVPTAISPVNLRGMVPAVAAIHQIVDSPCFLKPGAKDGSRSCVTMIQSCHMGVLMLKSLTQAASTPHGPGNVPLLRWHSSTKHQAQL